MSGPRRLGMFARYPQPGKVKTRLAASIGPQAAAEIYRQFVVALLRRLEQTADERAVVFTPEEYRGAFATLAGPCWSLVPQCEGDLGRRMQGYFQFARREGASHTVLIGSDSPTIPLEYIERAFAMLDERAVVLGPSDDGGYYLLGLRTDRAGGEIPPVFDGIRWGGELVFRDTIARLQRAGVPYAELPGWYDVDDLDDLIRLNQELEQQSDPSPAIAALHQAVRRTVEH